MEYIKEDGSKIEFITKLENPDNYTLFHHFKGIDYAIITIAPHSETRELHVVYESMSDAHHCVRPAEMFFSKMDTDKYPEIKQEYRFQKID